MPELVKRLRFPDLAKTLTINSAKKVEWQCNKCMEYFLSSPSNFLKSFKINKLGCPFCAGKIVNNKNNITITHPEVSNEWNYDKNVNSPEHYTAGSGARSKVWWKCSSNHEWEASINSRTGSPSKRGSTCPFCCHKISIIELEWLNSLNILLERQKIFRLNGMRFKVDGYDKNTNTIYEFYGDYFHGNPKIYDPDDFNYTCHKTFGQLYQKTIKKEEILLQNNFNLITMWERDWKLKF